MITYLRTAFCKWTPWEEAIIAAVLLKVGGKSQEILVSQIAAVNKVQRLLDWREINLYVMKNGKADRGSVPRLFDDREFAIAKVVTTIGSRQIHTSFSCVSGFLFTFDSDQEVRSIAFHKRCKVEVQELDRRFA